MNRPVVDNDLLQACYDFHGLMAWVWVALIGISLGASWYLLVGLRAGGQS